MNESTNHIDALLRQRLLEELPPALPTEAGWQALEQKLRADGDLQLRSVLTGLATSAPVAGWQALERRLDPRSAADSDLAEKLQSLQPDPAPGSWAMLAGRLDEENDKAVDAIVGSGLARSVAGHSTGWAQLAARLELIGWRRGCVAAWKITEGALLLSLLLLFVRFGPEPHPATMSPLAEGASGFPLPLAELRDTAADEAVPTANDTATAQPAAKPAQPSTKAVRPNNQPDFPLVSGLHEMMADFAQVSGSAAVVADEEVLEKLYLPASVATLPIRKLNKAVYLPSPALTLPKIDKGEPVYYYVNAFISPFDFNQVVTPATSIGDFDISGDRRFTQGASLGVLIDIEQGKSGLQVGAIYSRRSYIPTALKWYLQDEYTAFEPIKGYSRFIFESITFPLNYKRTLLTTEKWRVSGRIGMSLSVIARSSFKGQEDVVAGFNAFEERSPGLPPVSGSREPDRRVDFSGRRKLQNPPSGWLEGGSILANSSFYLGGGVVVERLISPRWSLYVSPTIGRVIYLQEDSGIGPYNDRINVGNLRLGSRYLFGGK